MGGGNVAGFPIVVQFGRWGRAWAKMGIWRSVETIKQRMMVFIFRLAVIGHTLNTFITSSPR